MAKIPPQKKPKAVYDPMKTPAGQRLKEASDFADRTRDRVHGQLDAVEKGGNKIGGAMGRPGMGTAATMSGPAKQYEQMMRNESTDRYLDAGVAYERQQNAANSGFAQHLGTLGEKPVAAPMKKPPALGGKAPKGNADALQQGFDSVRQVGDPVKK